MVSCIFRHLIFYSLFFILHFLKIIMIYICNKILKKNKIIFKYIKIMSDYELSFFSAYGVSPS